MLFMESILSEKMISVKSILSRYDVTITPSWHPCDPLQIWTHPIVQERSGGVALP